MVKKVKEEKWEKESKNKKLSANYDDYKKRAEEYGKKSIKDIETAKNEIIKLIAQSDYNSMLHIKKFAALNSIINELFLDVSNCFKAYNDLVKGIDIQRQEIEDIKREIEKIKAKKEG